MTRRVAAIDCGTNSIRLLVIERAADGTARELTRQMRIVRLGQDVDRTGRLAPEALSRTEQALGEFVGRMRELGVESVRMVATSATRDAANRDDFDAMVERVLGQRADVISGSEEAALSFAGAASGLSGPAGHVLVTDIGGGSTELILGTSGAAPAVAASFSMDIGCVRLTERLLLTDPPGRAEIATVEAAVDAALDRAVRAVPLDPSTRLVGVAGTVTTLAALVLGLDTYDRDRIHGAVLPVTAIVATTDALLAMNHAERAALPVMHPGRVDVIGAGAIILRVLLRRWGGTELTVSEHDILDGIAATVR